MRLFMLACLLASLLCSAQNIPVAPVPSGPYELVTGPVKLLEETDQRASVLGLIERARQNSDLHAPGGHPYELKVTFDASGSVPYTGSGSIEELWYAPGKWAWKGQLGSYKQARINLQGRMFDEVSSPMPLRMQMVRGTIFWPIIMMPGAALRIAAGTWKGAPVMCVLGSHMLGDDGHRPGRRWEETEFCISTKSGLLQTYSVAPGIYAVYDYNNAIKFHASTLPRNITIYEGNATVLQIRLDSVIDAAPFDAKLFTPTPQMVSSAAPRISGTYRFPMSGGPAPVNTHGLIQPVIVHASVNSEGKAEEVEALQDNDSALSAAAVALVKNSLRLPRPEMGRPRQGEVFVNVRFTPQPDQQGK